MNQPTNQPFALDPAAVQHYTGAAGDISAALTRAAESAGGAVDPAQLAADLGVLGADFSAAFTQAAGDHAAALAAIAQTVAGHGANLGTAGTAATGIDTALAEQLARAQQDGGQQV